MKSRKNIIFYEMQSQAPIYIEFFKKKYTYHALT